MHKYVRLSCNIPIFQVLADNFRSVDNTIGLYDVFLFVL
jgi:hypothetical protein